MNQYISESSQVLPSIRKREQRNNRIRDDVTECHEQGSLETKPMKHSPEKRLHLHGEVCSGFSDRFVGGHSDISEMTSFIH